MNIEERLERFLGSKPVVSEDAYIAPSATVVGDVELGPQSSVWPNAVLRGDINYIRVGRATNIQDGAIVHLSDEHPAVLGDEVTVGHAAVVHACKIEDGVLVGMHATILDGSVVGEGSIIGAHTLVKTGMKVPPGSLVLGCQDELCVNFLRMRLRRIEPSAKVCSSCSSSRCCQALIESYLRGLLF